MPKRYLIHAQWDDEAKVWVASSEDVLGLSTEADSIPDLVRKLQAMLPDLLKANGQIADTDGLPEVPFSVMSDHVARATAH